METSTASKTFGIIGGLRSLARADLFLKVVKSHPVLADQSRYHFLFEQHPFRDLVLPLTRTANLSSRKFYAFQVCQTLAIRGVTSILLPCFASHTFLPDLRPERWHHSAAVWRKRLFPWVWEISTQFPPVSPYHLIFSSL
jgi:aspartate racemase